jgi:DNA polymerase III epsilon subunit-like protein
MKTHYLFFDTETSGLPKTYKADVTDVDNWPRLVQLAYLVQDNKGNDVDFVSSIVRPDGFRIPVEVTAIHGISHDHAVREGLAIGLVLDDFMNSLDSCEMMVAHNIAFDEKIVGAELVRHLGREPVEFSERPRCCTMKGATDFCALPAKRRGTKFKWPKLHELHQKLFGCGFEGAHDAANDIRATAKCFWELKRRGVIA